MATYREELDFKNKQKIDELSKQIPQFLNLFIRDMQMANKSSNTILEYCRDLKLFFDWLSKSAGFKNDNLLSASPSILDRIEVEDIQEYIMETMSNRQVDSLDTKALKKYSYNTQARRIAVLKSMYKFYAKNKLIERDLSNLIATPKIHDSVIRTLDVKDVTRMIEAVSNTEGLSKLELVRHQKIELRDIAILYTLFGTGIRVSELVGLNMNSLDFDKAIFRVIRKGGNEAEVVFGMEVENALLNYINNARANLKPNKSDLDALFISTSHSRITVRAVQKLVKKYALKAGIADGDKITPHKARSTFATNLYNETSDISLVADTLGHSTVETTRKHYAKISDERKRQVAMHSSKLFEKEWWKVARMFKKGKR